MARKKKGVNRRKKGGKGKPLLVLLLLCLGLVLAFFILEKIRSKEPGAPQAEKPLAVQKHKLPPRHEIPSEFQSYTTTAKQAAPTTPKKKPVRRGTVAIIVDDMGSNVAEVKELMALKTPLTFAVIPGLPKDREVAEEAHRGGYQVMVHMPMEPKGYPRQRLEGNGLLLSQDEAEIERRTRSYFARIPHAAGGNNHMGSSFTEDEGKMRAALGVLREKRLFFVDSRTSPRSVGYSVARGLGIEAATRNVFLDNVQEVEAIRKQLDELAVTARKRGSAIGICHPHKATIRALAAAVPGMKESGISFVYASELVR